MYLNSAWSHLFRTAIPELIRSNRFAALLLLVMLAGVIAKVLSPDVLQTQRVDAQDTSASAMISGVGDCRRLQLDNIPSSTPAAGMALCPEADGSSENRFVAISHAFQHR